MAEDPVNQQAFADDVAAAAAAGGPAGFAGAEPGSPDFKMPSADEIWKMVESMEGISDTEREELRESIFNPKPPSPEDFMRQYGHPGHSSREYIFFFVMLALILLVFGKRPPRGTRATNTIVVKPYRVRYPRPLEAKGRAGAAISFRGPCQSIHTHSHTQPQASL